MTGVLRRNLGLKLVSLVLAYLAWTVVVGRPQITKHHDIPVRIAEGQETIVVDYSPKVIRTTIIGDETLFRDGVIEGLTATPDVSALSVGEHQVTISEEDIVNLPGELQIEFVDAFVTVSIEERIRRPLPVQLQIADSPPETHVLGDVRRDPEQVLVSGPRSVVEPLDRAFTEVVDLGGQTTTFSRSLRMTPPDRNVTIEPRTVRVTVEIRERPETREIEVPVSGLPDGWRSVPRLVTVRVTAPPSILDDALATVRARPRVDAPKPGVDVPLETAFPGLPESVAARVVETVASPAGVRLEPLGRKAP